MIYFHLISIPEMEEVAPSSSSDQSIAKTSKGISRQRYLATIYVLLAAIALMLSYILWSSNILGSEYPNEVTPIVQRTWGMTWTMSSGNQMDGYGPGFKYSETEFRFLELRSNEIGGGGGGGGISPATLARLNYSEFSVPATLEQAKAFTNGWQTGYGNVVEYVGFFISDETDPNEFNRGDTICMFRAVYENGQLIKSGFSEDYQYQIGFIWTASGNGPSARAAYEFAVDDGKLYSWVHSPEPSIWNLRIIGKP